MKRLTNEDQKCIVTSRELPGDFDLCQTLDLGSRQPSIGPPNTRSHLTLTRPSVGHGATSDSFGGCGDVSPASISSVYTSSYLSNASATESRTSSPLSPYSGPHISASLSSFIEPLPFGQSGRSDGTLSKLQPFQYQTRSSLSGTMDRHRSEAYKVSRQQARLTGGSLSPHKDRNVWQAPHISLPIDDSYGLQALQYSSDVFPISQSAFEHNNTSFTESANPVTYNHPPASSFQVSGSTGYYTTSSYQSFDFVGDRQNAYQSGLNGRTPRLPEYLSSAEYTDPDIYAPSTHPNSTTLQSRSEVFRMSDQHPSLSSSYRAHDTDPYTLRNSRQNPPSLQYHYR